MAENKKNNTQAPEEEEMEVITLEERTMYGSTDTKRTRKAHSNSSILLMTSCSRRLPRNSNPLCRIRRKARNRTSFNVQNAPAIRRCILLCWRV